MRALINSRLKRTIRNIAISAGIAVALLVAAGAAYTWYMGRHPVTSAAIVNEPVEAAPAIKPTQPAANSSVGVSVQSLVSPVAPGLNTSVSIRTTPSANCNISVVYKDVPSTDSGLKARQADEFGMASWTWTVGPSVPLGSWPVKITCSLGNKSGMVQADLVVANSN